MRAPSVGSKLLKTGHSIVAALLSAAHNGAPFQRAAGPSSDGCYGRPLRTRPRGIRNQSGFVTETISRAGVVSPTSGDRAEAVNCMDGNVAAGQTLVETVMHVLS